MVPCLTLLQQPDKGHQAGGARAAGAWGLAGQRVPFSSTLAVLSDSWQGAACRPGFLPRESKQGFGSAGERSGAVYKGDQGGLLLITCLSTAIKSSPCSQAQKSTCEGGTFH